MTAPHISVVLPNYNHGRYLRRSLQALLAQTVSATEIIVVDDGSTDDSRDVIAEIAKSNSRIRLICHQQNLGVIASLSSGLATATGEFIYFASADDFVDPSLFGTLVEPLLAHPELGLCCGEIRMVRDGGRAEGVRPVIRPAHSPSRFTPDATRALLQKSDHWFATTATLFRREAVRAAGGFDPQLHSLADMFLARHVALLKGFYFVPTVLASFRVNDEGVFGRDARDLVRIRTVLDRAQLRIRGNPAFPTNYDEAFARRFKFSMSRIALMSKPPQTDLLFRLGELSRFEARVWRALLPGGRLKRFLLLCALISKYHPMSLFRLADTAVRRKLESRRQL